MAAKRKSVRVGNMVLVTAPSKPAAAADLPQWQINDGRRFRATRAEAKERLRKAGHGMLERVEKATKDIRETDTYRGEWMMLEQILFEEV